MDEKKSISVVARIAIAAAAAGLMMLAGCASQQSAAQGTAQAQANQVAMNFDLSKCETVEPSLYRCPGSDKPICTPGFARADIECLKADDTGVLIQVP
jgi:hypothetical protein